MLETVRRYPFGEPDRMLLDPAYARLQRDEPLARVRMPYGDLALLATRHADVRAVLADARFSRAFGRDEPRTVEQLTDGGIFSLDPPEHTRIRGLVVKAFTVRRVEQLRERTEQLADRLVDEMIAHGGPLDLVEHFALPFPVTVMCELLGVPVADRKRFGTWASVIVATTSLSPEKIVEYRARLGIYMGRLIDRRRREPTDADLLGALVQARDDDDRLTEDELLHLSATLLSVGFETTSAEIPNFMYLLLTRPDLLHRLRAEPELLPTAVEELLRYSPIAAFAMFPRYAREDVELPGGPVRAGEPVLVHTAAANRDPRVFTDPDEIDLARSPNPHLALGHGVHHCLGGPLARMELRTMLATLIRRLPNLRLAVTAEEIPWKTGQLIRGPQSLPVTW
ncbi:cytochrome P450 [Allocatelliglobosispora scoriae]|uniref:Cytochrome P450 n=1 Tax=Allocatelliglobosispora scoriae TaxID=643052 RepID=A0A841C4N5_9ACTN|nr:cytochrome P450 [Allocatelliglobosispora scoriae]MBB5874103.1 cytochrome P450 [Allocatelliglobosispora scoriae]